MKTDSSENEGIAIVAGGQNVFGKEIISLELGSGLKAAGHEVTFVSSRWWGNGEFPRRLRELGIPARFMRLGFISATLRWDCIRMTLDQLIHVPSLWWSYRKFLREVRPLHVIHTNWHHLLMLWPFLSRRRDWFWVHDVVLDKAQYRGLFKILKERVYGFVAVSKSVASSLLKMGVEENQVYVVYNGIEHFDVKAVETPRSWSGVRIGIVGQVAPWKGHHHLLDVFGGLAPRWKDVELHIFGNGDPDFVKKLKDRAESLGVTHRVVWHGFIADKKEMYARIDLCVMPSQVSESFGLAVLEAGMCGLPVIASNVGALPEIVIEGETGFLHDPCDLGRLEECLEILLGNPELRRKMGTSARLHTAGKFSREQFVENFERLFSCCGQRIP